MLMLNVNECSGIRWHKPKKFYSRAAGKTAISKSTVQRILKEHKYYRLSFIQRTDCYPVICTAAPTAVYRSNSSYDCIYVFSSHLLVNETNVSIFKIINCTFCSLIYHRFLFLSLISSSHSC